MKRKMNSTTGQAEYLELKMGNFIKDYLRPRLMELMANVEPTTFGNSEKQEQSIFAGRSYYMQSLFFNGLGEYNKNKIK